MDVNATPAEAQVLNIIGTKVALGPLRRDLLPLYERWINDFAVTRTLAKCGPTSHEAEEDWYNHASRTDARIVFTIYERATGRPIGDTSLFNINYKHRTAEFGIIIGEKDCWGQGYGTEVAMLMLDYGFTGLGLHNICLRTLSFNERGQRAYRRAGFREIGRRREAYIVGGQAHDEVAMDCLATEFTSPVLRDVLLPEQ